MAKRYGYNPMGNPDPNYGKPNKLIVCHYEFADYRLIVRKSSAIVPCVYNLFIEKKALNAMNEENWVTLTSVQIDEPEDIYDFGRVVESGHGTLDIMTTLASILLYKRQDLLVDKMETKS